MNPSYLNFSSDSQSPEDEFVLHAQSIGQDFCSPPFQGSASEYHSAASQHSYSLLSQDGRETYQAPQVPATNSARSFRPSARSGSIRSSDSYHQPRLCHVADHAFALRQGCSRLPFPTFQAPAPVSGTAMLCNVSIGARGSTYRHNSNPLPLERKFAPAPTLRSVSQSGTMTTDMYQIMPSSMSGLMAPAETLPSIYQTPASLPDTPADQADIEFAQWRYSGKRCFYQCRFDLPGSPCNKWIVGDRTRVLRHLRNHHHLQIGPATPAVCRWAECTHSKPMKQENLSRHVVMHLGVKWRCPHCRRLFSRDDAVHRHIERMVPGMNVTDAEVVPGRDARVITEPQSKRARMA